jgi:hypothetical protein
MEQRGGLRGLAILCVVLVLVAVGFPAAQATGASQKSGPYRGKPVTDPEGLSGLWETSNGHGGFVGIHMVLGTSVAPDAKSDRKTLTGVEQQWEYLNLGVYEQKGAEFSLGEANYFSDHTEPPAMTIEDGHLVLHFVPPATGMPAVDLDLRKEEGDRWVGRFHRGSFEEQVTLERPRAGMKTHNAITGSWSSVGFMSRVVHVGEQAPGQFVGWSDMLQIPGTVRLAPWIQPYRLLQVYGDRVKVQRAGERGVLFESGAYSAACCSHTFAGKLSSDESWIESGAGPSAAGPFTKWKRVR